MNNPTLSPQSRVSQADGLIGSNLGEQTALLSIATGNYFELDDVGGRIWELLATPRRIGALCDLIVAEFNVERGRCESEVLAFLGRLSEFGLLQIHEG